MATDGTARALRSAGVGCTTVKKIHEGTPNVRDMLVGGQIALMINTLFGHATRNDGYELRTELPARHHAGHELAGAQAMVAGMRPARKTA